jgi:hypothetical protein
MLDLTCIAFILGSIAVIITIITSTITSSGAGFTRLRLVRRGFAPLTVGGNGMRCVLAPQVPSHCALVSQATSKLFEVYLHRYVSHSSVIE